MEKEKIEKYLELLNKEIERLNPYHHKKRI